MRKLFIFFAIILSMRIYAQSNVQAVDLGLPSGTLWADRNLGAKNIEDCGGYFSWGESTPKNKHSWSNYKFKGKYLHTQYGIKFYTLTKYVFKTNSWWYDGIIDSKSSLELEDDAAYQILGNEWCMPSSDQLKELMDLCTWTFCKQNGVFGYKVTGTNGNTIFLPRGGHLMDRKMYMKGRGPYLWSSEGHDLYATALANDSESGDPKNTVIKIEETRCSGCNIRAVISSKKRNQLAELLWNSELISKESTYKVVIGVKSPSLVTGYKVYLNNQLTRGVNSVVNDGYDFVINDVINLQNGDNEIRVEVTNRQGTNTIKQNVVYNPQSVIPKPTPNININTQKRIALVIGNGKYTHATTLLNPNNDATDISAKLRSLGFEVIEKHDLGKRAFKDVIREFGSKVQIYDAAVLYYAGHAIENNGKNYLIPVDADIKVQADVEDECIRADYIIESLENAKCKMNIIVLDACRNNPIPRSWSRGNSIGLSSMTAPTGTFIAFSTAPGHTADDGTGRNSPFTEAFLKNLDLPNTQLEVFFKKVLQDVSKKTSNRQIPWTQSSFIGDFYFNISK